MLNVITVEEAIKIIKENFTATNGRKNTFSALAYGRYTAEDIYSDEDVPSFSRSTMDGYALKASDTYGSGESMPAMLDIVGEVLMGEPAEMSLKSGTCVKISTGGMLPEGADAVIPVENTDEDNGVCLVYKSVSPFENVTKKGDDISIGECIIKKGTQLKTAQLGLLASAGKERVTVEENPRIGIISTGNEIVGAFEKPTAGKIRDVNSLIIGDICAAHGCNFKNYGIMKDDYEQIYNAVLSAKSECDAVLISGGSSAGTKDMTVKIIEDMGTVLAHGIAMKPGKPTIIGKADGKAVIGLPGHPAACYFVMEIIVKELIYRLKGREEKEEASELVLTENISSNHGREEFVCVRAEGNSATPVYGKSGLLSTICESDGYIRIDRNCEGLKKGDTVSFYPFRR